MPAPTSQILVSHLLTARRLLVPMGSAPHGHAPRPEIAPAAYATTTRARRKPNRLTSDQLKRQMEQPQKKLRLPGTHNKALAELE